MSEELVRCIECGDFVSFEDAYVVSHDVDEDGQTVENCVCENCYHEHYETAGC